MKKGKLLWRLVEHNESLVFAPADRARLIARMHEAIEGSKTWEEFRRAMPRAEYSKIVRSFDEEGEPRPKGSDDFDGEMVPGWSDGDYPPWLQQEMSRHIPKTLLQRFGEYETIVMNGNVWLIPPEAADALCTELRALGWTVEHAPELGFR